MESKLRWALVTAIAPIAWGSTYYVTQEWLPADYPLWGGVIRALPAGILMLALVRTLPRGSWWWKSLVLGTLNVGAFFVLIYIAAQLLPSSIATVLMAAAPAAMMVLAWVILAERPHILAAAGAVLGFAGVSTMLLTGGDAIDPVGVLTALTAMLMSSVGYVLTKKWAKDVAVMPLTAWQITAGGLVVVPFALALEGAPPALGGSEIAAFAYVGLVATGVAYWAWFTGLKHLGPGAVGLIGLLNPVVGVLLGTLVAAEVLGTLQVVGIAIVLLGIVIGQPFVLRLVERRRESTA
ncbi:MAG: EamA family transporter [Cryobacterium sp.]|nr:EamA family transporter [Cryobacterium sp.]